MSLKDFRKKGASALAGLPPARPVSEIVGSRPVTAPGMTAMMQPLIDELTTRAEIAEAKAAQAEELQSQLDTAQQALQQWDGAKATRLLDPKTIRPSRWANRSELHFKTPEFEALKAEIQEAGGNVQPIKVRPIRTPGDKHAFESVYGHRRHRACLELGLPVLALVDELDDAALFVEMDRENRARQDLSPWEQGVMYRRALDAGLFPSQRRLAAALGVEQGNVSKAVALAALPDDVVQAFPSPLDLQYRWLAPLCDALQRDPEAVLKRSRELRMLTPRLPAKDVLAKLTHAEAPVAPTPVRSFTRDGKVAGSWERDARGTVTLRLKPGTLTPEAERQVLAVLAKFFD